MFRPNPITHEAFQLQRVLRCSCLPGRYEHDGSYMIQNNEKELHEAIRKEKLMQSTIRKYTKSHKHIIMSNKRIDVLKKLLNDFNYHNSSNVDTGYSLILVKYDRILTLCDNGFELYNEYIIS